MKTGIFGLVHVEKYGARCLLSIPHVIKQWVFLRSVLKVTVCILLQNII